MTAESTLVLIKPDGVNRGLIGNVISRLESTGLKISGLKLIQIDNELAGKHYQEHKEKPFFAPSFQIPKSKNIIYYLISGCSNCYFWSRCN